MTIYVVKTEDGDRYFQRQVCVPKKRVRELGVHQMLYARRGDYDPDERHNLRVADDARDYDRVWEILLAEGVVTVANVEK